MSFRRPTAFVLTAFLFALPLLPGCGANVGGYDYKAGQAQSSYSAHQATVVGVHPVTIHGDARTQQSLGGILGTTVGMLIGSTIGGGSGHALGAAGGALIGGATGVGAGTLASRETGLQITVRDDYGNEEIIVQGAEPAVRPGQRVRVIVGQDGSRRVELAN